MSPVLSAPATAPAASADEFAYPMRILLHTCAISSPGAYTPKTLTRIRKAILQGRKDSYAIVDEELEAGLRSIAVPVFTRGNQVVAAINIGTHISRVDSATLMRSCLPALQKGARTLRSILI